MNFLASLKVLSLPCVSYQLPFMYRYILAALEEGRHQVQILHEYDSCCFRAASLHDEIKDYNAYVRARVRAHVRLRPALRY